MEFLSSDSSDDEDIKMKAKAINIPKKIPRIETFMQVIDQYNDNEVSVNITFSNKFHNKFLFILQYNIENILYFY